MLKSMLPTTWWCRCLWIVATYVLAADVFPVSLLILVNSSGYLPYSDRPGPGWQLPHFPTFEELLFFTSFAFLLLTTTAFFGGVFAGAGWVLGFCSLPRWALRIFASPIAFIASGLTMAGVGWMIAISSTGVLIAAGCGALWGLFVFPRLVTPMNYSLPITVRIAIPLSMLAGGTYWLIKPLLPDSALTNAKVEVIRRDDTGADLSEIDLSHIGSLIAQKAKGSGKYTSVNRLAFTTDGRNQVRILVIIDDPIPITHTFLLPRVGDVIYHQIHGKWKEERTDPANSNLSLQLASLSSSDIKLEISGPCCTSMTQSMGPFRSPRVGQKKK